MSRSAARYHLQAYIPQRHSRLRAGSRACLVAALVSAHPHAVRQYYRERVFYPHGGHADAFHSPPRRRPIGAMRRPRSATNFGLCCIALAVGLALVWMIAPGHIAGAASIIPYVPLIPCLGIVAVIAVSEWLFPRLRSASEPLYAGPALRPINIARVAVRLLGLGATLALVGFAYWLLPEYHGDFYRPYWQFLRSIAPVAMVMHRA